MSTIDQNGSECLLRALGAVTDELLASAANAGGDLSVVETALFRAIGSVRSLLVSASLQAAEASTPEQYSCRTCHARLVGWGSYKREIVTACGGGRARVRRYRCQGCGAEFVPMLVRNGLENTCYTLGARQAIAEEASDRAFAPASERLGKLGISVSAASVERISDEVSKLREQEEEALRGYLMLHGRDLNLPLHDVRRWKRVERDAALVVSVDGAMVRSNTAGDGTLEWFEIRAGALTLSADDAPKVCVAGVTDPNRLFETLLSQARQVGKSRKVAFVADGANWIWSRASQYFGNATQILDIYHAGEHVASAARALWGEGAATAKLWSGSARSMLLEKDGHRSILRQLARGLRNAQADNNDELVTEFRYLWRHRRRMKYWQFQKQNLPVGSGVMESIIKQTSSQRLRQPGMMWTREGADSMLRLRAAHINKSLHLTMHRQNQICLNRLTDYQMTV